MKSNWREKNSFSRLKCVCCALCGMSTMLCDLKGVGKYPINLLNILWTNAINKINFIDAPFIICAWADKWSWMPMSNQMNCYCSYFGSRGCRYYRNIFVNCRLAFAFLFELTKKRRENPFKTLKEYKIWKIILSNMQTIFTIGSKRSWTRYKLAIFVLKFIRELKRETARCHSAHLYIHSHVNVVVQHIIT